VVIVDTTVWIDYLRLVENPQTDWLDRNLDSQRIALTDFIFLETLQGVRNPLQFSQLQEDLLRFEVYSTGGIDLAIAAAANYRTLRDRGYTVRKTIDSLIATFCLEAGHELLHRDRDFEPFERELGLKVVHPI
jgi:predicted nucleic acid-binding protein